jgi:uncharacterized membrane protein
MPEPANEPLRSPQLERNVAAIIQLDQQAMEQRSIMNRWSDAIGRFVGSPGFIAMQGALFAGWIWVNRADSTMRFDPFPHSWLMLTLALEAICISSFVLISQRQIQERADKRAHVHLQFNLLVEAEMTKALSMLQTLRAELGATDDADDDELKELASRTEVQQVVEAIEQHMTPPTDPLASPPTSK